MIPKLTPELSDALRTVGDQPLAVIDPSTNQVYVLVDQSQHQRAIEALRKQEDLQAIKMGIADMEAGRVSPVDEAFDRIEKKLRARPQQ